MPSAPAPFDSAATPSCSVELPPVPSGGGCKAPVPDCFNKAFPQLGTSVYRDTVGSSEMAFASRYSPSYFSPDAVKATAAAAAATTRPATAPSLVHPTKSPCAAQVGGGSGSRRRRRRAAKGLKKHRSASVKARQTGGGSRRRRRSARARRSARRPQRKARGGGYYLDLSSCPPGGMPSPMGYSDTAPPYFGGKANARGAPCEPRTYAKGNVGLCDSRVHKAS